MTLEQWLTPTLAATMPRVARAIPWLLLLGAMEVLGAVVTSFFLMRAAIRIGAGESSRLSHLWTSNLRDTARYLARARIALIIIAAGTVATWIVLSATRGISAETNELLFSLTLGAVLLPTYVTVTVLGRSMSRAADIAGHNVQASSRP